MLLLEGLLILMMKKVVVVVVVEYYFVLKNQLIKMILKIHVCYQIKLHVFSLHFLPITIFEFK